MTLPPFGSILRQSCVHIISVQPADVSVFATATSVIGYQQKSMEGGRLFAFYSIFYGLKVFKPSKTK